MNVTVRPAQPGDGAGIVRVRSSAAAFYTALDPAHFQVPQGEHMAEDWDAFLGQEDSSSLQLVAETGGWVIGWLSARIELPEDSAAIQLTREHGWTRLAVDALIVDQAHWRNGSGTALLKAAEAWGHDRGAQIARLDTFAHSPVSMLFCEDHMGYQRRAITFQKRL